MSPTYGCVLQGVYGLVTNLGSLVVRLLFQPFEEAAFLAFSRCAAGSPAGRGADPSPGKPCAHAATLCDSTSRLDPGLAVSSVELTGHCETQPRALPASLLYPP